MRRASTYFMKTARLGFSHWREDDIDLAVGLWGDHDVTRLIGGPFSLEAIRERLTREIATQEAHGSQYWPIFLLSNDAHAGCGGLRPYQTEDGIYEVGFHLLPIHWGKGLAEEAGRAIISYGFDELGAKALFAGHHPANTASRRVLEKLGFRFTHEEFYPPTGLKHPSYLLSNTR